MAIEKDLDKAIESLGLSKKEAEVLSLLFQYGDIDGGHHKMWVIDQAVRKLTGDKYGEVLYAANYGEDGAGTYKWDEGIAP